METDKNRLRQEMRKRRNRLSEQEVLHKSQKIFNIITENSCYKKADYIFSYMSFRNEVDTEKFHRKVLEDGKILLLPRVLSKEVMEFYQINDMSRLKKSSMGILEPDETCELYVHNKHFLENDFNSTLHFMILPGLAYDHSFGRLGYGGGYYDRYLEKNNVGIIRCGVAFDFQWIKEIPCTVYDARMDIIVTDEQWIERVDAR